MCQERKHAVPQLPSVGCFCHPYFFRWVKRKKRGGRPTANLGGEEGVGMGTLGVMAVQRVHTEEQMPVPGSDPEHQGPGPRKLVVWWRNRLLGTNLGQRSYNARNSPAIGRGGKAQQLNPIPSNLETHHRLTHLLSSSYLNLEQKKQQMTQAAEAEAHRLVQRLGGGRECGGEKGRV